LLKAANVGAAYGPIAQEAAALAHNESYSFFVIVANFSAALIFPLYLNSVPKAMKQVDP
jgi:hypothetical protein